MDIPNGGGGGGDMNEEAGVQGNGRSRAIKEGSVGWKKQVRAWNRQTGLKTYHGGKGDMWRLFDFAYY